MNNFAIGFNSAKRSDTYTVTGTGTIVQPPRTLKYFSIQLKGTVAGATSWTVTLEGSLDGTNFSTIITHSTADLDGSVKWSTSASPSLYFRSNCSALVLGGATNIVVTILGTE